VFAKIRNYDPGCQSARQISDIMDLAADIITQEELDSLDIFHIIEVDPIIPRTRMPMKFNAAHSSQVGNAACERNPRLEIDGEVVLDGQEYDLSPDEKPVLLPGP